MCDVLDRVEEKGIETGKREMAISLHNQGVDEAIIAKAAGVAVEVVRKWLGLVLA